MEEYRSNSMKSKAKDVAAEKKVVEKITTGKVKTRKRNEIQRFADEFIAEDLGNFKRYIIFDVLIPWIKKGIWDIGTNGLDMLLYHGQGGGKSSGGQRTPYQSMYPKVNSQQSSQTIHSIYSFNNFTFDNRADAEEVLERMRDILATYGTVSVADMYDLAGITGQFTDNKYGWTDLKSAYVDRVYDGYLIRLPRVLTLK